MPWLRKPFPQIQSIRDITLISLGSGSIVLGILVVFKPFGIEDIDLDMLKYLSGYSLIDTFITAFLLLLPRALPARLSTRHWTIGKNLAAIICWFVVISICNYFYGEYLAGREFVDGFKEMHRGGILTWLLMTFAVGVIPLVFALYFIEKRLYSRNQLRADAYSTVIKESTMTEAEALITVGSGSDSIPAIKLSDFICLRAEGGNYASVFWRDGVDIKKKLMRLTLAGFLDQLMHVESIVRCHKSYVINLEHIRSFQGNARSVTVILEGLDFEVPVSRSFPKEKLEKRS